MKLTDRVTIYYLSGNEPRPRLWHPEVAPLPRSLHWTKEGAQAAIDKRQTDIKAERKQCEPEALKLYNKAVELYKAFNIELYKLNAAYYVDAEALDDTGLETSEIIRVTVQGAKYMHEYHYQL